MICDYYDRGKNLTFKYFLNVEHSFFRIHKFPFPLCRLQVLLISCVVIHLKKKRMLTGFENMKLTSNFMPLTGKNLEVGDSLGM